MKWIGLTGGIATGKSTVSQTLQAQGYRVIDADQIAKEVVQKGSRGLDLVVQHFGPAVLGPDANLDRKKLGAMVFSDLEKRKELEAIVHPLIQARVHELKMQAELDHCRVCFYDVPLLFEKKLQAQFDQVWLVSCSPETQLQRLMLRDHLDQQAAQSRIQAQIPITEKEKMADLVLHNDADIENLKKQVDAAIQSIQT